MGAEDRTHTGIRSSDRPARGESLYRLDLLEMKLNVFVPIFSHFVDSFVSL